MTSPATDDDLVRLGATRLGLKTQWRHAFLPAGSSHATTPDAVYLDIGGQLAPGVIDTHSGDGSAACTAQLVVERPELVHGHLIGPWLRRAAEGQALEDRTWSPALVTHLHPDFDAAVSALLVQLLVEDGDLPSWAAGLAAYAASVDQGRWQIDLHDERSWRRPVHMAFLALQNLPVDPALGSVHKQRLLRGIELVQAEVDAVLTAVNLSDHRAPDFLSLSTPGLGGWRDDARFEDLREALDQDQARFQADLAAARLETVSLPARDGGAHLQVPAFIANTPPTSMLSKYWVRASGRPYFLCPYQPDPSRVGHFRRGILSLDPNWSHEGRHPTLQGLGYALERRECAVRAAQPEGDVRPPIPRWNDGTCDNAQPWYDGRGHDFMIVDAPLPVGTELPWEEVVRIGTGTFWTVEPVELVLLLVEPAPGEGLGGGDPPSSLAPLMLRLGGAMAVGDGPPLVEDAPGLALQWSARVSFTRDTAPAASVIELRAPGRVPLEPVLAWLAQRLKNSPDQRALLAFRLHGAIWPESAVREALTRYLPASEKTTLVAPDGAAELGKITVCGARAVVLESALERALDDVLPIDLAVHLLLNDLALDDYARTSKRVLEGRLDRLESPVGRWVKLLRAGRRALIASRATSVAPRIRLLEFRGTVVPAGPPAPGAWPQAAASLADTLDLEGRRLAVEQELAELAELEKSDAERSMEWLLFLIGLFGVTSTVFDWISLTEAKRWSWETYGWIALFDAPLVLVFLLLWLRRPRSG